MISQKKLDRAMDWLKEKNKEQKGTVQLDSQKIDDEILNEDNENAQLLEEDEEIQLEKGDLFAIITSAFLVFSPIIIVLILILVLVLRL